MAICQEWYVVSLTECNSGTTQKLLFIVNTRTMFEHKYYNCV
jgi:hypothetical protein